MSPWLFNVYMDGVVRDVHARSLGRGSSLVNADGRVEPESTVVCR